MILGKLEVCLELGKINAALLLCGLTWVQFLHLRRCVWFPKLVEQYLGMNRDSFLVLSMEGRSDSFLNGPKTKL